MSDTDDSSSDADYLPSEGEAVSEEEESGDDESWLKAEDGHCTSSVSGKRKRTPKKSPKSRKRTGGIRLDGDVEQVTEGHCEPERLKEEVKNDEEMKKEEEKRKEDLWSSFLKDVGQKPKKSSSQTEVDAESRRKEVEPPDKLSVTKTYNFAGESISVSEKVDANSKEGQKELKRLDENEGGQPASNHKLPSVNSSSSQKSGLTGILGKLGKTTKMSCLDKSKLDWDSYKQGKGIEDELRTHNKGKEGYVDRLDFLSRTDQRQFEIECSLRHSSRKH